MSEQAYLFLLRERLKKIKRDRGNATFLSLAIAVIATIIVQRYWNDFLTAVVICGAVGILFALTVIHHYDVQEAQVLWKMEQMAKGEYIELTLIGS